MNSKLNWCLNKGIELIKPNLELSDKYYKAARETLEILKVINNSKIWTPTLLYYFRYFLALSIITKTGIKSEIHSCTIEIIKLMNTDITDKLYDDLILDKNLRTENQYYLKGNDFKVDIKELEKQFVEIKIFIISIDKEIYNRVRNIISQRTNH